MRRLLVRALGALVVVGLLLAGYVAYAVVRAQRSVVLPSVAGGYAVGRRSLEVPANGGDPGLSVWLWYPARSAGGRRAAYAPGAWSGLHLPAPVGWLETPFDRVRVRSRVGATAAAGRFPLAVLLPGLGFAAPQYQALAETMAAHGFVVVGVTPTHSANLTVLGGRPVTSSREGDPPSFEGGHGSADEATGERLLRAWVADARLAERSVRAGPEGPRRRAGTVYVGHSFGGAAALQACAQDGACAGAVDLDGTQYGSVVEDGLRVPTLLVGHDDSCVVGACRAASAADRADRAVARRLAAASSGPTWSMSFEGTQHFGFTDYAAYDEALPLRRILALGADDGPRRLAAISSVVTRFALSVAGGGRGFAGGAAPRGADLRLLRP